MDLNLTKYAIIWCPNKAKLKPTIFKTFIQAQRITFKGKQFPILTQNEPYSYSGIQLVPSLKWQIQKDITMNEAKEQSKLRLASSTTIRQKIRIFNTVIKLGIAYIYYGVPFTKPYTRKVNKILSKLTKNVCKIQISTTNILTHLNTKNFGINATFVLPNYLTCISKQLIQALNDPRTQGKVYQWLTKCIVTKDGGSLGLPKLTYQTCSRSPTTKTLFLLEKIFESHIDNGDKTFPIQQTPLETQWCSNSQYASLPNEKK